MSVQLIKTSSSPTNSSDLHSCEVYTSLPSAFATLPCSLFELRSERVILPTRFAYAMEDRSLSRERLTMTSEAVMSQSLLPLCVSAGGTTRPLEAAVEQVDTDTYTHTCMQTHAHTHQTERPKQPTQYVAGCVLPLSFISLCCRCGQLVHEHAHRRL